MNTEQYTSTQVVTALRETKGMITLAARRLGCSRVTIYRYKDLYPEVKEALVDEREAVTDMAELSLYGQIKDGQPWAVCFYLKTQGKERGYIERKELTGKDGEPLVNGYRITPPENAGPGED